METKYSAENWEEFWTKTGANLKEAGLAIRDRRYVCLRTPAAGSLANHRH